MSESTNTVQEVQEKSVANIHAGFSTKNAWELLKGQAVTLSRSSLVPKEFQNKPENCLIALNMANRLCADPLMVMQNLYVVYGRPGWSSQFLIATFNTFGKFTALRYTFVGTPENDDYGCYAWAIEKETGERLVGTTVTVSIAKKEGWYDKKSKTSGESASKWPTMTDQMLRYRAASWFIRAYAPEISMGLQTVEELVDTTIEVNSDGSVNVENTMQEPATAKETLKNVLAGTSTNDFTDDVQNSEALFAENVR